MAAQLLRRYQGTPGRRAYVLEGLVQGVGLRPFLYREAVALGLAGFVQNTQQGLTLEVEGPAEQISKLASVLEGPLPAPARIDAIATVELPAGHEVGFAILESESTGGVGCALPPDLAPCNACLRELGDPADRRYQYPFIACACCGPRFSIVRAPPYDRDRTTMAAFPFCPSCRDEYQQPLSRRFHAQASACPDCGPTLSFVAPGSPTARADDALARCLVALIRGEVVAIKAVGGFQLICDARNSKAVQTLRARKQRLARPLAVLAADPEQIRGYAELDDDERLAISSAARPIVLLRKRAADLPPEVAPGLARVGFMLPASPLHVLLATRFGAPLVVTSGNLANEPIAITNSAALAQLGTIADGFLIHDRDIHARVDDSLLQVDQRQPRLLRRARGYVPQPVALGCEKPLLAIGADLKNTFCLVSHGKAHVGPHIGDLHRAATRAEFLPSLESFRRGLSIQPEVVACELSKDSASARLAEAFDLPVIRVQHHHAHLAACLAEHGINGPVVGVVLDGAGLGPDGTLWGGEVLIADRRRFERAAHLRPVRLPGGEAAMRQPWRMALAYRLDCGLAIEGVAPPEVGESALIALCQAVERGVCSPWTSSAGRLFDAVAALCGLRQVAQFEGQAAMELEAACASWPQAPAYPYVLSAGAPLQVDLRPAIRALVEDLERKVSCDEVSARFHSTLAAALAQVAIWLAHQHGLGQVVLSGGCFQNARLAAHSQVLLERAGLCVLRPERFPCNDGGISLGQAAVAAAQLGGG